MWALKLSGDGHWLELQSISPELLCEKISTASQTLLYHVAALYIVCVCVCVHMRKCVKVCMSVCTECKHVSTTDHILAVKVHTLLQTTRKRKDLITC